MPASLASLLTRTALLLMALPIGVACRGSDAEGPVLSVLVRGAQFLPAQTTTADQYRPTVAATAGQVVFSDASSTPLKKVPAEGGAVTPIAPGAVSQLLPRFAFSGSSLLVADGTLIKNVPLSGGTVTTVLDIGAQPVGDLVSDGSSVLVGFVGGGARRLTLDGGSFTDYVAALAPPGNGSRCRVRVAQDGTHVYWLSSGALSPDDCAIWRAPAAGGAAVALVEGVIVDFAISGQELFFTERFRSTTGNLTASGQLKRISIEGGNVTELSASGAEVAVDAAAIFVGGGIALSIVPRSGGTTTYLSDSSAAGGTEVENAFDDLFVGGGSAYLVNTVGGTVLRATPVP
jgi:hypothetical protein